MSLLRDLESLDVFGSPHGRDQTRPFLVSTKAGEVHAELGFFSVLLDLAGRAEIILEECLQLFVFFGHGFHLRVAASK